jgi:hypothetical protein
LPCRPQGHLVQKLGEVGFVLDDPATQQLRGATDVPWLKANVLVLRRKGRKERDVAHRAESLLK